MLESQTRQFCTEWNTIVWKWHIFSSLPYVLQLQHEDSYYYTAKLPVNFFVQKKSVFSFDTSFIWYSLSLLYFPSKVPLFHHFQVVKFFVAFLFEVHKLFLTHACTYCIITISFTNPLCTFCFTFPRLNRKSKLCQIHISYSALVFTKIT